ncbi:MAG: LamG domain-containing protein, partial [Lentisphaerae bacterium]|nr:LamG domain-containing protein [Lentisphaerota bacterium]
MVKTRRSSKTACALTLFAIFHIACVHGETVGRWSFDGTVGATVSIGTRFLNKMNSSKFPADVVNRYNSSASTGHLSSISTFDAEPFDACRESKFGVDMRVDKSLHFDGKPAYSQGCPLYIADPDGDLELQSFTFECFVRRPTTATGNQYQMYFSKMYHYFGTGMGTYYNGLLRNANSVWYYHWCCVTNAAGDVGYGDIYLGSRGIEDGQWHHVALTVDGENRKVGFFIDHQKVMTANLPGPLA